MKAVMLRYLNEIVSLTVMALMVVALVAGQGAAPVSDTGRGDAGFIVKLDIDGDSIEAIRDVLEIRSGRED